MIFFCKNVPCTTNFFISLVFNHSFTENMISQESIMDSFVVPLFASLFSNYGPADILCLLVVSHICGHEVFPSFITYSGIERRSIVCTMKRRLATVSLERCPHVQETMPSLQYDRHALHCVLGSVSNNSNNSMLPTS